MAENLLCEAEPMILYYPLPLVVFKPVDKNTKISTKNPIFNCACYAYPIREGTNE